MNGERVTCMTALPPSVTVTRLWPTGSFCTASARETFTEPSCTWERVRVGVNVALRVLGSLYHPKGQTLFFNFFMLKCFIGS